MGVCLLLWSSPALALPREIPPKVSSGILVLTTGLHWEHPLAEPGFARGPQPQMLLTYGRTAELGHPSRAGHPFIRALLTPSTRCPFCGEPAPCPPLCCVPTRVPSPPAPQSSRGHGNVTRTALSLLKLFSFSPFLFFHPFFCLSFFFFFLSPLPLSIPRCAPRLCELEGRPDKKLVFLSDPFTKPPLRLLLPAPFSSQIYGQPRRKCRH